jgi:hypothetical protein
MSKKRNKFYYKDGTTSGKINESKILHRVGGPAIEKADGTKVWWVDGKCHRVDGPAVEHSNGYRMWFVHDKMHRVDGPARESASGAKEWWIDDEEYTEKQFNELIKEINKMSLVMRLTDPRWWVRELGEKELKLVV